MNRTLLDRLLDWWQVDDMHKRDLRRLSVVLAITIAALIVTGTTLDEPLEFVR